MIVAGADPGSKGALSFIDAENRRVVACISMPMAGAELMVRDLVRDVTGSLDGRRVAALYVERQAPFVRDKTARIGATTAFNLGQRYMALKAIAACLGWSCEIVTAVKWQSAFGITKADKVLSLATASQLMPQDAQLWATQRGSINKAQAIGRAEASLIALYGVRQLAGIGRAALLSPDLGMRVAGGQASLSPRGVG